MARLHGAPQRREGGLGGGGGGAEDECEEQDDGEALLVAVEGGAIHLLDLPWHDHMRADTPVRYAVCPWVAFFHCNSGMNN